MRVEELLKYLHLRKSILFSLKTGRYWKREIHFIFISVYHICFIDKYTRINKVLNIYFYLSLSVFFQWVHYKL